MQCTANLRNNGEIDHIKLNWSKDNLLTRWSELTGVDPPSFSSRKCYIYTCIHSPSNMRRAAAASHLWGPRPRRCRPRRHCRWSSAPGTGCSRPASPCRGGQYYHQLSQWRASPRLAQCRPLSGNCQFLLRNWWKRKLLCCPLTSFVESVDRWEGWKSTLQSTFTILNCQYFLPGPPGQNNNNCTLHLRLLVWLADCQGCGRGGGRLGSEGGVAGDVLRLFDLWHHLAVILHTGLHPAWRAKH